MTIYKQPGSPYYYYDFYFEEHAATVPPETRSL